MSSASLNIVFPLFGIMATGYIFARFGILKPASSEILSRFIYVAAFPALIFVSLSTVPVSEFFHWSFLGALGGGMLSIFLISLLVARFAFPDTLTARGLHALTAMFSSTGYIGLPMILLIFGDEGLVPGIIGAVITVSLFLPMAIVLGEVDKGQDQKHIFLTSLCSVFKNPLLIATIAGLLVSGSGWIVPQPINAFCEILGGAFVPCALFAAGLFMASCSVKGAATEISWLIAVKLLLHPLVTWWLAYHVFELEGILPAIAVLQASLPSGVPVFILAQQYNTFVARSSAVIVLSTAISVFTLSALLIFMEV